MAAVVLLLILTRVVTSLKDAPDAYVSVHLLANRWLWEIAPLFAENIKV